MPDGGNIDAQAQGRVVRIGFNEPSIDVVLQMGFNRLVVERSTDAGLSYSEITLAHERPVLKAGKTDYVFIDKVGDSEYLYRTRYISEDGKTCSDPSDSIKGGGAILLQLLPVQQLLQRYFFGVDITNDAGESLPDEVFQHYILAAIAWLEHELDIRIAPTTFLGESADYYAADYPEFSIIQLENYPVISLEEFKVEYPSGQTVVTFPDEWVRLDKTHGIVRIVPTAGTLSNIILGQGGAFLPAVYSGLSHLPDLFKIDYTAGFQAVPANLLELIGMMAALGPFNIFGDLIAGAGIANLSVSIDGLSQNIGTTSSATNSGYGARIRQYLDQIKKQLPNLRRYYKGIRMISA